uniref:DNA topoisomerase I n=1 Tax=Rhabditophanes sp. KR3021 TaxID=114890 RepID=A0AC35TTJ7_9BILA
MAATLAPQQISNGSQRLSTRSHDVHLNGAMAKKTDIGQESNDKDDIPWGQRVKEEVIPKSEKSRSSKRKKRESSGSEYEDAAEKSKSDKKSKKKAKKCDVKEEVETPAKKSKGSKRKIKEETVSEDDTPVPAKKRKVKEECDSSTPKKKPKVKKEEEEVWKWWEEEKKPEGIKWNTLYHNGPLFAPGYERVPESIHFKYDGKVVKLSEETEEVATFYSKMLEHEYTSKPDFNRNFMEDWRSVMTPKEKELIKDIKKCDFSEFAAHFLKQTEIRKAMSKEEKLAIKEENEKKLLEYGFAYIDGHKQKIGNFRIEPPGLFRGRGGHPKMGKLKRRIVPEDVIINCSPDKVPAPPKGHKWKEVRNDNSVSWLVCWTENVLSNNKYIMLNPSSKMKGEKDWEKFETARKLKQKINEIRDVYMKDWKSKEMRVRQRAVALYFIDKLALRAGNEKDVDEAADTVGCCSLRCEHIKLHDEKDGKSYVVEFDFLGKDSIRYQNEVPVEKTVFKNLKIFMQQKEGSDDLFDRLDTSTLNSHLSTLMPGLTVKVFRTYNASFTLQDQLNKLSKAGDSVTNQLLSYNRANREVALLCNHQRAVPKSHEKSMENLGVKIKEKKKELKKVKTELEAASSKDKEKFEKKLAKTKEALKKLKVQKIDKDENKQIALGTSKLNYIDPRITVAWCKKMEVPIEKIFSKTHREKFQWALDMTEDDYEF